MCATWLFESERKISRSSLSICGCGIGPCEVVEIAYKDTM